MKNIIILMMSLLLSATIYAQTPQYSLSGGTSNNTIPLMSTTNRVQWVYARTDFPGLPTGSQLITRIYLRSGTTTASAVFTNLTIRIGHTNLTTFPNGTFVTGLTTVFAATTHTVTSVTAGGWVAFNLQTPFTYNGTQNLIVEVSQTGYSGGFTVRQSTAGGNKRIFGTVISTTGTASTGIADLGIDIYPIFACAKSTPLPAININSNAALLRWSPVAGAVSYDYMVSTNPSWPSSGWTNTTATSVFNTGLNPSTTYYLLVRARCSATTFSFWDTVSFVTLPPCSTPSGFKVTKLDSNNADILWRKVPTAQKYQYLVDKTRSLPSVAEMSQAITTTDTFVMLKNLTEATKYYVHIRSLCAGNDSSNWSIDSFTTPRSCKAVVMVADVISKTTALIHWDTVQTANRYEYFKSLTPDLPNVGTPIVNNFVQFNTLQPATMYYVHSRSLCSDVGVSASSPWSTIAFSTTAMNVSSYLVSQFKDDVNIYPNPATHTLFIEMRNNNTGEIKYELTDMVGRVVKNGIIESKQTSVNITDLPQGAYMLKVHNSNENLYYKVIKE